MPMSALRPVCRPLGYAAPGGFCPGRSEFSGARRGIADALGVWSERVEEGQEAVGRGIPP